MSSAGEAIREGERIRTPEGLFIVEDVDRFKGTCTLVPVWPDNTRILSQVSKGVQLGLVEGWDRA